MKISTEENGLLCVMMPQAISVTTHQEIRKCLGYCDTERSQSGVSVSIAFMCPCLLCVFNGVTNLI